MVNETEANSTVIVSNDTAGPAAPVVVKKDTSGKTTVIMPKLKSDKVQKKEEEVT